MKKLMFAAIAALTLTVGALSGVANAAQNQPQTQNSANYDYGLNGGGG